MSASLWLVAALACAQTDPAADEARKPDEGPAAVPAAANRITSVTVYQGQALVTREVRVPEGEGTVELVVSPLPARTLDSSVYAEGSDGLRVLTTRFRSRAVKTDTRESVREKEAQIKKLADEAHRLKGQVGTRAHDLKYLEKLEGFTATAVGDLTKQGRFEGGDFIALSRFLMDDRAAKSADEVTLRLQLQANADEAALAARQLAELSSGSSRIERDAVIVVNRPARAAGTVRLSYLVGSASWTAQYRLRGSADNGPVRLEYLAAVVQQTGEDWPDVEVTLSTARPSLDAAPPALLPLEMAVADAVDSGPVEASDDRSRAVAAVLAKPLDMAFPNETPLEDVLKYIRAATTGPGFPEGLPIYVDPIGLQEAEKTPNSPVAIDLRQVPLRTSLKLLLHQLGLTYRVDDGVLRVVYPSSPDESPYHDPAWGAGFDGGMMAAMGGMGMAGMGMSLELAHAASGARLNQQAASDQAGELHVDDQGGPADASADEKDGPGVTFAVAGRLDLPERRDPQLLEIARVDLPADPYAKAVPVLTPRVYRLAKLTNTSNLVLLPGEATVYVGRDFVGRMRLPLVAAGEPFVVGLGTDPQLQASRRLLRKARTIQGGNQVFTYEFRIGLRNYRKEPVKVELWDRLPRPRGETVAVTLTSTSAELSTEALYQRSARLDNLLRWDLEVAPGTVGEHTKYVHYEFRLEYARDLPQPHFLSGGLNERPIGGGAMGGMGGMTGGFLSIEPARD